MTSKVIAKPEIDRLFAKYKGKDTILLYTPYSSLVGNVNISLNSDNKPQSITICVNSYDKDAIAYFLAQIISQKINQGYKTNERLGLEKLEIVKSLLESANYLVTGSELIDYLYTKGKMYFLVKSSFEKETVIDGDKSHGDNFVYTVVCKYTFYIETGDYSRFGGSNQTKFDF